MNYLGSSGALLGEIVVWQTLVGLLTPTLPNFSGCSAYSSESGVSEGSKSAFLHLGFLLCLHAEIRQIHVCSGCVGIPLGYPINRFGFIPIFPR